MAKSNKQHGAGDGCGGCNFWNKTLRTRHDETKKEMEAPVKIPVSIVKRMILVIRKCVFLKRGLRSNYDTTSVDELHLAR